MASEIELIISGFFPPLNSWAEFGDRDIEKGLERGLVCSEEEIREVMNDAGSILSSAGSMSILDEPSCQSKGDKEPTVPLVA